MNDFNRNDKQKYFNTIRGVITELNDAEVYCSVTINVGHENPRIVNLSCKKERFNTFCKVLQVGDKVIVRFYVTSKKKDKKYFTFVNILEIEKDTYKKE